MSKSSWQESPTLRSHRVLLRPTRPSDIEGLIAAHDDDETLRYFPYGIESEPPSERGLAHLLASGRQFLTQIDARTDRVVGLTSLYNMNQAHERLTVGFTWLSQSVRGTGFNREAKILLLDHVFEGLLARRAEFNVDDQNARSRRALIAMGATEEGALRSHAQRRDGTWRTTIVYSILGEEWPKLRLALQGSTMVDPVGPESPTAGLLEKRTTS